MIKVEIVNDLFLVEERDFQSLNSKGFGKRNNNLYELEVCEVLFLLEKGTIEVYEKNDSFLSSKFKKFAENKLSFKQVLRRYSISRIDYLVYKDLRTKGYYVQSGLKFGFRFRVYDKGIKISEDHSLWLVEPVLETDVMKIKDLTGKNRVAHSTKKKMILAVVDNEDNVTYIQTSWKRL